MNDAARLLEGLRIQEVRYRAVAEAVGDQARATAAGDVDGLLKAVARQTNLLREIEDVGRDLAPLRARWPELKAAADPALAAAVEDTLRRTRDLLEGLLREAGGAPAPAARPPAPRLRAAYGG